MNSFPGGVKYDIVHYAQPKKQVKRVVFGQTASDSRDTLRGPKSPYFRNKGVSNSSRRD